MGRLTPTHPQHVKEAIGQAALAGQSAASIRLALAAGTLEDGLEAYEMPASTVAYYCRAARSRARQSVVSRLAAGDAAKAVDHLARQLLTEAELGIAQARQGKRRDPESVKRWADVLRVVRPLLVAEAATPARPKRPTDPLTRKLLEDRQDNPSLRPGEARGEGEENGRMAENTAERETSDAAGPFPDSVRWPG